MANKNKIAVCIIAKPSDAEADVLYRLLSTDGLHLKVDKVFITITCKEGDPRGDKVKKVAESVKAEISYFEWTGDFAAARNYNFSQVSQEYGWIMWLDCDDIVKNSDNIQLLLDKTTDVMSGIILPYLYDFDEDQECTVRHNKYRIIRNDGSFKWQGLYLHEDLVEQREVLPYFSKDVLICHLTNATRVNDSIKRNVEITTKAIKDFPKDPKAYWNHANALYMNGQLDEAIDTFFRFIEISGSEEEVYMAWDRISKIYFFQRKLEYAVEASLEALRIRPWYPDAYFSLAQCYYDTQKFRHAKEMLLTGLQKEPPELTAIVWNPRDYDYNPLNLLAKTYMKLGQPKEATQILEKMVKMFPKKKQLQPWYEELKKLSEEDDEVNKICKDILKAKNKTEIKKLIDSAPDRLKSHPKLCTVRNAHFFKTESTGKDISIYCFQTAEDWNPDLIKKTGSGGSEEAVVNMAKGLGELGWNVNVYNSCGPHKLKYGKVTYYPFWEFNPKDKTDILISWRTPMVYSHELNAKQKYVWLHDTLPQNEFTNKRLNNLDKIFVLSDYHRSLYPSLPDDKFILSSNGVDISQFDNTACPNCGNDKLVRHEEIYCDKCGYHHYDESKFQKIKKIPGRLIYTSAPERGLETLLTLWPRIKEQVPEATLAVYYGWNTWDSVYQSDPQQQEWKKRIERLLEQDGIVTKYERITHDKIAEEMLKAEIFAYPTEFTEINCCTGDTLIDLPRDHYKYPNGIPISELEGKSNFPVWSMDLSDFKFKLSNVKWVKKTGSNREVWKLTLDDGSTLKTTPDHKILLNDGSWKMMKDLLPGDSVVPLRKRLTVAVKQTDGSWLQEYREVGKYKEKRELTKKDHVHHLDDTHYDTSPEMIQVLDESTHHSITHKGHIKSPITRQKLSISNTERFKQKKWKNWAKKQGRDRANKFWEDVKTWTEEEQKAFFRMRVERKKLVQQNHKVVSVEFCGYEDVYDMEVENTHNFVANGIVIHNCISVQKAQCAGAIPVTTDVAALEQFNEFGIKVKGSNIYSNPDLQDKWVDEIVSLLKDPDRMTELRNKMIEPAKKKYSWQNTIQQWSDIFANEKKNN